MSLSEKNVSTPTLDSTYEISPQITTVAATRAVANAKRDTAEFDSPRVATDGGRE